MAYRGPDEKPESVTAIESLSGSAVQIEARNTSNSASSDATLKAQVAGGSAGDAKVELAVSGVTTWTIGVDNDPDDSLKIGPSATVGTSTAVTISTAGVTTVASLAATNAALTTPTVTGALTVPLGTSGAPSITFSGDTNTGIYSSGADQVRLVGGGVVGIKASVDGGEVTDGSGNAILSGSGGTTSLSSGGSQRLAASSSGVTVATVGIITPVGSAAAPSHTFTGDTDTGLYASTTDNVDVATGGTQRLNISSNGVEVKTIGIITPLGSASAPSHTFTSDPNTGVYSSTADNVDIATGGTQRVNISSAGLDVKTVGIIAPLGSASAPSHTFTGDGNTGIYSSTADNVDIATGGTQRVNVSSTGMSVTGLVTTSEGVAFPATQVPNAGANVLDDYEEGTWTPTIIGTSAAGTGTYTSQVGSYTKVGRMVTAYGRCDWSAHTGTGSMMMSLPFTARTLTNLFLPCAVNVYNISLTASNTAFGQLRSAEANVRLMQQPVGGGADSAVTLDTAGNWAFQITYEV